MRKTLTIMDSEGDFALRFMEAASGRSNLPYEIRAFTDPEKLADYLSYGRTDVLLMSKKDMSVEMSGYGASSIIILTDTRVNGGMCSYEGRLYPTVFKYQSVTAILKEIAEAASERNISAGSASGSFIKPRMTCAGIFSPVGRCGKTTFSDILASALSYTRPTLILNLESCSASRMDDVSENISDIIYYMRQGEDHIDGRLMGAIKDEGQIGRLPPFVQPGDVLKVTNDEWKELIRCIRTESPYESLVIDLGDVPYAAPAILDECDVIYMPVISSEISSKKVELFESSLMGSQISHVIHKIRKMKLMLHEDTARGGGDAVIRKRLMGEAISCIERDGL